MKVFALLLPLLFASPAFADDGDKQVIETPTGTITIEGNKLTIQGQATEEELKASEQLRIERMKSGNAAELENQKIIKAKYEEGLRKEQLEERAKVAAQKTNEYHPTKQRIVYSRGVGKKTIQKQGSEVPKIDYAEINRQREERIERQQQGEEARERAEQSFKTAVDWAYMEHPPVKYTSDMNPELARELGRVDGDLRVRRGADIAKAEKQRGKRLATIDKLYGKGYRTPKQAGD